MTAIKVREPKCRSPKTKCLFIAMTGMFAVTVHHMATNMERFMPNDKLGTSISKTLNPAQFPFVLSTIDPNDSNNFVDLMEEDDGIKHIEKSSTWEGDRTLTVTIEYDEWMLANAFVQEGDVVIEFGARFGTTSCILSRNVGKTGHVIAVEPDVLVHGHLMRNQYRHRCPFHIVFGTVSKTPLYMGKSEGYGTRTSTSKEIGAHPIPNVDVASIEVTLGKRINVALIDCEGCIPSVQETGLLDEEYGVDVILMEEDMIDYTPWYEELSKQGYKCVWFIKDTVSPTKQWSIDMRHSAWIHKRVEKERLFTTCNEYVKLKGYNSSQIVCADCPV